MLIAESIRILYNIKYLNLSKGGITMAYDSIKPYAIDLFCGAGGLSLGLQNAGIDVKLGIEINPVAAETYMHNLPGEVLIQDIKSVNAADILNYLQIKKGELFLLAGCPPCQTFSTLQRDDVSDDDRNNLIFEYIRLVNGLCPLFIQLENVPGLKRGRGKKFFEEALNKLNDNYKIVCDVLNCADYGIPQLRKRLVLHGIRKDVFAIIRRFNPAFEISLPKQTHASADMHNHKLPAWVPAKIAFENLPPITGGEPAPVGYPNHETNALSEINVRRIKYIQAHGGSRSCLPESLQLPCHKKKNVCYTGVYGIINPSIPAPTITGGCINFTKGRFGHPTQPRAISIREAARLQSFHDNFIFHGSRGQAALQVGNAVPPHLAELSGLYFINLLAYLHRLPD